MTTFIADSIRLPPDPGVVRYHFMMITDPRVIENPLMKIVPARTMEEALRVAVWSTRDVIHLGDTTVRLPRGVTYYKSMSYGYARETYK